MKPRRTPTASLVLRLEGGNEDNDLWVERGRDLDDNECLVSVWELNDLERAAIAGGDTVELIVWGTSHPPVAMRLGPSIEVRRAEANGG